MTNTDDTSVDNALWDLQRNTQTLDSNWKNHKLADGDQLFQLRDEAKLAIYQAIVKGMPDKRPTDDREIDSWEEGYRNSGYNEGVKEAIESIRNTLGIKDANE